MSSSINEAAALKQASISDITQEDGTLRWLSTSSLKETVYISSTFRRPIKKLEEAYMFVREIAIGRRRPFFS